jgi:hypothetical protein
MNGHSDLIEIPRQRIERLLQALALHDLTMPCNNPLRVKGCQLYNRLFCVLEILRVIHRWSVEFGGLRCHGICRFLCRCDEGIGRDERFIFSTSQRNVNGGVKLGHYSPPFLFFVAVQN